MTAPGTAAELTALADHIDTKLGDEYADRQYICEETERKLRDIASRMPGRVPAPAAATPLETEAQARELPAVRAIYDAMHERLGVADEMCARLITDACGAAGVELGAYDRRIVPWLAGWEPQTCAVVAGLITRATGTDAGLAPEQLATLGQALADAIEWRHPAEFHCADCDAATLCPDHAGDLDRADAYRALARALGIEAER